MFIDKELQRMLDITLELANSVVSEEGCKMCAVPNEDDLESEITEQVWTHESNVLGEKYVGVIDDQGDKVNFTILTFDTMTYLRFTKEYENIVEKYGSETLDGFSKTAALFLETFVGEIGDGEYFLEKNSITVVSELIGLIVDNIIS